MKLVHMASGLAVAIALAACADKSADIQTPAPAANTSISATQQPAIQQPNVSGTVWIRQKVALPPDAVLTVTLSDASLADAPSKVLAQKAVRTEGKQSPFSFVLSFNPADVQPNARILLSAAITVNDKLVFITDTVAAAGAPAIGRFAFPKGGHQALARTALFFDVRNPLLVPGKRQSYKKSVCRFE